MIDILPWRYAKLFFELLFKLGAGESCYVRQKFQRQFLRKVFADISKYTLDIGGNRGGFPLGVCQDYVQEQLKQRCNQIGIFPPEG